MPVALDKIGQACSFGMVMNLRANREPHAYGLIARAMGRTNFKPLTETTMEMREIKNLLNYRGISSRSPSATDILKSTQKRLRGTIGYSVIKTLQHVIIGSEYVTSSGHNLATLHQRGVRKTGGMIPGKKIPPRRILGFDKWMIETSLRITRSRLKRAIGRIR